MTGKKSNKDIAHQIVAITLMKVLTGMVLCDAIAGKDDAMRDRFVAKTTDNLVEGTTKLLDENYGVGEVEDDGTGTEVDDTGNLADSEAGVGGRADGAAT